MPTTAAVHPSAAAPARRVLPVLLLLALALMALRAAPVDGQERPAPPSPADPSAAAPFDVDLTGRRVRFREGGPGADRVVAVARGAEGDTLYLADGRRRPTSAPGAVAIADLHRLEVSHGRRRGVGALRGAAAGLLIGPILGGISGSDEDDVTGLGALAGVVGGLIAGPIVGAPIGALLLAPERWELVPLPYR